MRAIIIAAGEATRWNNYLGTPKHLIRIDGEPLLHRTVRLLKQYTDDIFVVAKDDPLYLIDGATRYVPTLNYEAHADADKFLSSKELWNDKGRTVVFYGDVYFTEYAMHKIASYWVKDWTLFCRPHASMYTGTPWGECFAQSFYPEHIEQHEAKLMHIARLFKRGRIDRCGGWEHYRAMIGLRDDQIRSKQIKGNIVTIDDFTDDFDYPDDYDRFIEMRQNFPKE